MTHLLLGRTVRGILQGDSSPKQFILRLVAHDRAGRFPIDSSITHDTFANINQALADLASGKVITPVLEIHDP